MRISLMAAFLALFMVLAACQTDDTGMGNDNGQTNYEQTGYNNTNDNDRGNQMNTGTRNGNGDQKQGNRGSGVNDNEFDTGNQQDNFELAEEIAERVVNNVDEVEDANVMTGDQNAYVAVELNNNRGGNGNENNDVSQKVKDQISDVVQTSNSQIENVYVSANPDFVGSLNDYAERVEEGDPVEGFFEEMNEMIQRIFPDLHENNN